MSSITWNRFAALFVLLFVDHSENSLHSLKLGKSGGIDGLTKENILYSHPAVLVHLKLLFNMICTHGFVPDNFGMGACIIVAVFKDRLGDVCSANNYRPVTLSPVISKIFEYCVFVTFRRHYCFFNCVFAYVND